MTSMCPYCWLEFDDTFDSVFHQVTTHMPPALGPEAQAMLATGILVLHPGPRKRMRKERSPA